MASAKVREQQLTFADQKVQSPAIRVRDRSGDILIPRTGLLVPFERRKPTSLLDFYKMGMGQILTESG